MFHRSFGYIYTIQWKRSISYTFLPTNQRLKKTPKRCYSPWHGNMASREPYLGIVSALNVCQFSFSTNYLYSRQISFVACHIKWTLTFVSSCWSVVSRQIENESINKWASDSDLMIASIIRLSFHFLNDDLI